MSKNVTSPGKPVKSTKTKQQTHRRSRTGCYTCRLRRKKCDEGTPSCTACKHLGLSCAYKRPPWWSSQDARQKKKDEIKVSIKRTKTTEKSARHALAQPPVSLTMALPHSIISPPPPHMSYDPSIAAHYVGTSPPMLDPSVPGSAAFSDPSDDGSLRSGSIDETAGMLGFVPAGGFASPDMGGFAPGTYCTPEMFLGHTAAGFSPYEIDVKTERQMFVNDVPTMRESTVSTFSAFGVPHNFDWYGPSSTDTLPESFTEALGEKDMSCNVFEYHPELNTSSLILPPTTTTVTSVDVQVELEENDQVLLDHFIQAVLPTIFPVLDASDSTSPATDRILPALQSNKCYLHCCLAIAAQHLKATQGPNQELEDALTRHRCNTVSMLCQALAADEDHEEILDVTLALIFFQSVVGTVESSLQDIPWHQHVQAALSVAQKLGLPEPVSEDPVDEKDASPAQPTPYNSTLLSWIDILGATMSGVAPLFAHTYRERHTSKTSSSLGLRALMGCDDHVMYLISEIACLEGLRAGGMGDIPLCNHVAALGAQITATETLQTPAMASSPYTPANTLNTTQLTANITVAFRLAARIYLCSLVPGFSPAQSSCITLVDKLTSTLHFIPPGYDRALAWVYLVAGSVALPGSSFRDTFHERLANMGPGATLGALGQVEMVLSELWTQMESQLAAHGAAQAAAGTNELPGYIHWRTVMQAKGWDLLVM